MGLSFKKELTLADEQVFPPSKHMKSLGKTRLQAQYIYQDSKLFASVVYLLYCTGSNWFMDVFDQTSQEGIKCTKAKEWLRSYCLNLYTVTTGKTGHQIGSELVSVSTQFPKTLSYFCQFDSSS